MISTGCISLTKVSIATALAFVGITNSFAATDFGDALTGGKVSLDMRYRYEFVDQDGIANEAKASTLRTRLGYTTGEFYNFGAKLEFEDVTEIGADDYSKPGYPVVADPQGTEVNQAYLQYTGLDNTVLRWGRQLVNLDNQRFVGGVNFRQNQQTHDAFAIVNNSVEHLNLFYAYVNNVNTVTQANVDVDAHLLHAGYNVLNLGKLSGYGYLIEFNDAPAASHQTWGFRFAGGLENFSYAFEYATQDNYKDGVASIDADYWVLEGGIQLDYVTATIGFEQLGGDGTYAFQTPLGTNHKFNGWADKFLATPVDGLEDFYITLKSNIGGMDLILAYHDFSADNTSADYGSEWDFKVAKQFDAGKLQYSLALEYAVYSEDGLFTDTDKLWLTGGLRF